MTAANALGGFKRLRENNAERESGDADWTRKGSVDCFAEAPAGDMRGQRVGGCSGRGRQGGRSNVPSKASSESLYSDSDSEDNGQDIFSSLHHRNQSPLGKPPDVVAFELAMKDCNRWLENECR